MEVLASLFEGSVAIVVLCCGIYLGWNHAPKLEFGKKVPYMLGVLFSTFPPLGLGLYVFYWELNPPFSSACGTQAWLGLIYFIVSRMISSAFPPDKW